MKKKKNYHTEISCNGSLVDTHCHLDMESYADDLLEVIGRAKAARISHVISIGIDIKSSKKAVLLAQRLSGIKAAIGIHPHYTDKVSEEDYQHLRSLHKKYPEHIVGYGEIGLDYAKKHAKPENQRRHFNRQLELARELNLPIIIHNRDANAETLEILKTHTPFVRSGLMHCFSGDEKFAEDVIDMGLLISIPGIVTFKNAPQLHRVVQSAPLEKMVLETDGPFLSPHPFRGKRNEPAHILFTAQQVATLKGLNIDEVAEQTSQNARRLFNLEKTQTL
ncbi:MAG: hydrolase TatD [Deltaproteobacteria bacterium]|nr:MAG: hydrolase TatD [Deltaproteobacteria bacterium]